jgi:glycopeptide antibiotics resistance protein
MDIKQISKRLVICGIILIGFVKFLLRPLYPVENNTLVFLLGVAPNLLTAFLIPFGAYGFLNGRHFLLARLCKINSLYDLRFVCILGLAILVANEYLQHISFLGRTFDYYDILFSVVGVAAGYFIFKKIIRGAFGTYQIQENL